jgi:hypothetical protein
MMDDGSVQSSGLTGDWLASTKVRHALVVVVVIGALLRIVLTILAADVSNPNLWEFGIIARNLVETGTYAFYRPDVPTAFMPPAYPLMIAGLYKLFGINAVAHTVLAAILLVFEIALPILLAWIAWRVWNGNVAVVTLVLATFWPHLLLMSGRLSNLPLYTSFLVAAFAIPLAPRGSVVWRAVLSGALIGGFVLMRFEGMLYVIPLVLLIRQRARVEHPKMPRRTVMLAMLLPVVVCATMLAPWMIRNTMVFGTPVLATSGGFNLIRGHNPLALGTGRDFITRKWAKMPAHPSILPKDIDEAADEVTRDRYFRDEAISFALENPGREIILSARKVFFYLVADFSHPVDRLPIVWVPTFVALVIGLMHWIRSRRFDAASVTFWALYAIQLLLAVAMFVITRYRIMVCWIPLLFFSVWITERVVPYICTRWNKTEV